ncbi:serine protease 1-like [Phlebotomus argentipes]|uniref:serine protease 1-like n=1 Tax=Phlebotomus argentipes TaxID=94469 RepID=UPI002892E3DE|nr:serine protease 1-like [Phlebotomus argentipes]
MYKIVILVALLGFALGNPVAEDAPQGFVSGGTNAQQGEFPSTASVRVHNEFFQGVLVNQNHVLTAGTTCTLNGRSVNHFWIRVMLGDLHITGSSMHREERTLTHLFIHDGFNHQTGVNNICVLRLAHPIQLPHPVIEEAILNTRIVPVGTSVQFAGWQTPIPAADNLRFLRQFNMPIITNAVCTTPPGNINTQLVNMFCAGQLTPAPTASPCLGNVGAGLYWNRQLIGILHDGLTCNQVNNPSIYMDVRFYSTWITQTFTRTDLIPPNTEFPRAAPAQETQN